MFLEIAKALHYALYHDRPSGALFAIGPVYQTGALTALLLRSAACTMLTAVEI